MLTDQQLAAVNSVDKHVLVSAGAGSGKTHVLVERYVEILRKSPPSTALSSIIAVTYTRKAASEMRSRLKAKFLSLSKDEKELQNGNCLRWLNCLSEVDSARIGTIHSLCESIIRAYPADSGIDPEFESLDDLTISTLVSEAIDQAFRDVILQSEQIDEIENSGEDNQDEKSNQDEKVNVSGKSNENGKSNESGSSNDSGKSNESGSSNDSGKSCLEYAVLLSFRTEDIREILENLINKSIQFDEALQTCPELTTEGLLARARTFIEKVKAQELAKISNNSAFRRAFHYISTNPISAPGNKLEVARLHVRALGEQVLASPAKESDSLEMQSARFQALIEIALYSVGNIGGNKPDAKDMRLNLKALKMAAVEAVAGIPSSLGPEDERAMSMAIGVIRLYKRAQLFYQAAKAERTCLDFNDLIARAKICLNKRGSQAKSYFNEKLCALLVDEFQDTNDVQAELLASLAGAQTKVFLIGDDKQSIYKFQGADVATFNRWKQGFASQTSALVGESMVTKLNRSFRSDPGVVHFVNALFAGLLDADPEVLPYVADFEALEPARQSVSARAQKQVVALGSDNPSAGGGAGESVAASDGDVSGRQNTVVDMVLFDVEEAVPGPLPPEQLEAAVVAHWIKSKVDGGYVIEEKGGECRPIAFGDFAVLVSKNVDFDKFEEVFPRAGIPYVAFGGKGFLRRQEVTDFENLFRFLENPRDSHSLLAVLRSPLCPLTDDVIHKVALADFADTTAPARKADSYKSRPPLWVLLTEAANDSRPESRANLSSIRQAVRLLRTMLDYASLLPLAELVHKIIALTKYDLAVMAADDGKQRSRNVWKIAHLAREYEHLTCGEFAQRLQDMRDHGMKESEAPLDSGNSVKLMTVHASKGLEFPAVALPCLGGQLNTRPRRLLFHRSYGVAFNTRRLEEVENPPWYDMAAEFDKKMDIEEKKRLFYVAMTRARDLLGLFVRDTAKNSKSYRRWLREHLGLSGDDVLRPQSGSSITINVPIALAGATAATRGASSAGGSAQSQYTLTKWIGFPPLDLNCKSLSQLPSPVGRLNDLLDEPAESVFQSPLNELALVRLTPSAADFTFSSAKVIGTFFHALMENLPQSKKVDREWVRDIAYNQGFHFVHPLRLESFVDEGMRLLDIYYQSPLRKLVDGAHRCFYEMPYLMDSGEWITTRRPDLIIEAADGQWYLIDYKTDKFDPSQIVRQVRKHREQLLGYVQDLKRISGIELKAALYFAQFGSIEHVE